MASQFPTPALVPVFRKTSPEQLSWSVLPAMRPAGRVAREDPPAVVVGGVAGDRGVGVRGVAKVEAGVAAAVGGVAREAGAQGDESGDAVAAVTRRHVLRRAGVAHVGEDDAGAGKPRTVKPVTLTPALSRAYGPVGRRWRRRPIDAGILLVDGGEEELEADLCRVGRRVKDQSTGLPAPLRVRPSLAMRRFSS